MDWEKIDVLTDEKQHVSKFVFSKSDAVVETVLYRYPTFVERTVICCSVQSGCPIGCRFCGTGDYFVRSLTTEEIVSQVEYALSKTEVDPAGIKKLQIMTMSMGEPMLNLKNLIPALEQLHVKYPDAALLVSTSAPDIDYEPFFELSERISNVGLQFSVHESTDEARNNLVPFKKKLTLSGIARVGTLWYDRTGRRPFFNYCAHEKNSSKEDVERLYELYDPTIFNATVSVICERSDGMQATNEFQRNLASDFASQLLTYGFDVRVFDPAGQDTIGGGCGMLHQSQKWFKLHPEKVRPSCGNGKVQVHVPTKNI